MYTMYPEERSVGLTTSALRLWKRLSRDNSQVVWRPRNLSSVSLVNHGSARLESETEKCKRDNKGVVTPKSKGIKYPNASAIKMCWIPSGPGNRSETMDLKQSLGIAYPKLAIKSLVRFDNLLIICGNCRGEIISYKGTMRTIVDSISNVQEFYVVKGLNPNYRIRVSEFLSKTQNVRSNQIIYI